MRVPLPTPYATETVRAEIEIAAPPEFRFPIWSAVIVGVILAILAYVLLRKGMADLAPENLMPTRTAKNVQRDASAVKEAYHDA